MKTEAIKKCIIGYGYGTGANCSPTPLALEAEDELEALETALAVKKAENASLVGAIEGALRIKQLWRYPDDVMPQHEGEAAAITEMEGSFELALSTAPTGKVLVGGRTAKVVQGGKFFILITETEPYFNVAYSMIRCQERKQKTWTLADERRYLVHMKDDSLIIPKYLVAVDVEKLRSLWAFLDEAYATQVGAGNKTLHDWAVWLGNLVKGGGDGA